MRWLLRVGMALGVMGVLIAVAVAVWPLHANGVSGSALRPHYDKYFAFSAIGPLPAHPTVADLRQLGVRLPRDVVNHRRDIALRLLAVGVLVVVASAATAMRTRRRPNEPTAAHLQP